MDEIWTRVAIIAAALLVATLVVAVRRRKALTTPRRIAATGLLPGIYLFTSADCAECSLARSKLDDSLGERLYHEVAWDCQPEIFIRLGVEAVPATMIVEADGSGGLWLGQPDNLPLGP